MVFLLSKLMRNVVILYIIFSAIQWGLKSKSYTISPKEFKSIAAKATGGPLQSAVGSLSNDLRRSYGPAIVHDAPWTALTLGGHDLRALFFHASLTEYLAVIGTPLASNGRVGIHWSNSSCTVLTGTVTRFTDSISFGKKETFKAGDNFRHGQFESQIYSFSDETYMVCYGRGVIPFSTLPALTGALARGEPVSFANLVFAYGHSTYNNVALSAMQTFNHYKARATGGKSEL